MAKKPVKTARPAAKKVARKKVALKKVALKKKAAPKRAAAKRPAPKKVAAKKVPLQHVPWHTIPLEDLKPLLQRQFIVGQEIMVARVLLAQGCIVPEHSHHNEQLTYILEGALKFRIDGRDIVVSAGEVLCIPAHMPHQAEALADTVDLDVFTPPREDWMSGTDKYLRGVK
jgi:quercetin dioxygenase-like cupin family protein